MEKFVKLALKDIKNFDEKLSDFLVNQSAENKNEVLNCYNNLLKFIRNDLNQNEELNQLSNEAVKIRDDLTFDIRSEFQTYCEDNNIRENFNGEMVENAQYHILNWEKEKQKLSKKAEKINSSSFLKFFSKSKLNRIENQIKVGDTKFNKYKAIFDRYIENKNLDKSALEKVLREKISLIKDGINQTIEANIIKSVKENPIIIAYNDYKNEKQNKNSNLVVENKNLNRYIKNNEVDNKLNEVLEAYKTLTKHSLEKINLEENLEPNKE